MDVKQLIKQVEKQDITVIFLNGLDEPGRLIEVNGQPIMFIDKSLDNLTTYNVILHELSHYENDHLNNILSQVPTYANRLEHEAEKDRIINFMSLINEEYPIDETFNYVSYMKLAQVPSRYENLVKEISKQFYNRNKKEKRI